MADHMVVDCTTGEAHILSEGMSVTTSDGQTFHHHELEANHKKIQEDHQRHEREVAAVQGADLAAIREAAKKDPAFAALARQLGIQL